MKDTLFSSNLRLNTKGILREYSKPIVMGILNATPDSFYAESRVSGIPLALSRAEEMILEGATILDVGGYSSRPGASAVSELEEIQRTSALISAIKTAYPSTLISIDTFRAAVANEALNQGADIVNDISGGKIEPEIFNVSAQQGAPFIMMHMRGTPANMMENTHYQNLTKEVLYYFSEQVTRAKECGIKDIIIDPGFGFSKTLEQNFELMNQLHLLSGMDLPLLVGVSRKSMIYKTLDIAPEESMNGTTVLNTIALHKGAKILRVHDVKEAVEAIELSHLIKTGQRTL